jgi:hypothetical protein
MLKGWRPFSYGTFFEPRQVIGALRPVRASIPRVRCQVDEIGKRACVS